MKTYRNFLFFIFPLGILSLFSPRQMILSVRVCAHVTDNYHVNKIFNLKSFSVFELLLNNVFYLDVTLLH